MKSVDSITTKAKKVEKEIEKTIEKEVKFFNYKKDLKRQKKLDKLVQKEKKKADKTKVKKKLQKSKKKSKKNQTSIYRKAMVITAWAVLITISASFLLFSGAVYAYKSSYENKALWGTEIFGEDFGGKTEEEVREAVVQGLDEMRLNLKIEDENIEIIPGVAGIEFLEDEIVNDVLENGRIGQWYTPWVSSVASILHRINPSFNNGMSEMFTEVVVPKYEVNEAVFEGFISKISEDFHTESKNAGLVMKGTEVQVIPAVYGKAIVGDSIRAQIESSIIDNGARDVQIDVNEIQPDIIEEETKKSIDLAQELISQPIKFTYKGKNYIPTKAEVGSWVQFSEVDGLLTPKIGESKLKAYLDKVAKGINVASVVQKVKVINGAEEQITQKGKDGLAVDTKSTAKIATEKMNSEKAVEMELPTYVVKFKTQVNNVLVADWDKYIEVDISSQRMCAYLAGGKKVDCWAITTGARGWDTPIGTFLISRKAGAGGVAGGPSGGGVCMPNPPSTTPLCGINYVSTFTSQGHAIHEAWWRTYTSYNHFGNSNYAWNGSHGCVNAYYDVAKFIYNWAPIGTPVVIHY